MSARPPEPPGGKEGRAADDPAAVFLPRMPRVERRVSRFLREPPTIKNAISVIVTANTLVVIVAGVAMRIFDPHNFPNIGLGMWWAVQTVTTVGYGDVTPTDVLGRIVATIVMLEGIAFVAITTAAITSTFVARAQRERQAIQDRAHGTEDSRFDDLAQRLERIESMLRDLERR
jgi:voltage-gated potassium channel